MAKQSFKSFKDTKTRQPWMGAANSSTRPSVSEVFPKGPNVKFARVDFTKPSEINWNDVFDTIKKNDRAFAEQQRRALAQTQAAEREIKSAKITQSNRNTASPVYHASAQNADNLRIHNAVVSGALPKDYAKKLKGRQYADLPVELQRLIDQADRARAEIEMMGDKPKSSKQNSVLNRTLDVLSRGMYMSANAMRRAEKAEQADKGGAEWLKQFGIGAWKGLSGKEKTTYSQLLHTPEVEGGAGWTKPKSTKGKVGHFSVGLLSDIILDPTTYAGIGAARAVIQGGSAGLKAAKIGGVTQKIAKNTPMTIKESKELQKHIDNLMDLDMAKVGYRPLDPIDGKPIKADDFKLPADEASRRAFIEDLFTPGRASKGTPEQIRSAIAQQVKQADHFLSYAKAAEKAAIAEKTSAALKLWSPAVFIQKSSEEIFKHFETTAAADIMQQMAREGKQFLDIPNPVVKAGTLKLNPKKAKAFEKEMDKKIASAKAAITKAKKEGKSSDEIRTLENKRYDLEHERNYHITYGKPIADEAPDPRIWDYKLDYRQTKAAKEHNQALANELKTRIESIRPTGLKETHKALLEIAHKGIDAEVTRLIQLRFGAPFGSGGAVLATFKAPDIFRKAAEKYAREGHDRNALNTYNKAVMGFSKIFRASGSLNRHIDEARLRTSGRAHELIAAHVADLRQRYGKISKSNRQGLMKAYHDGVPPEGLGDEFTDLLNDFDLELQGMGKLIDGSMVDELGPLDANDIFKWLPKRVKPDVSATKGIPVGTSEWWQAALKGVISRDIAEVHHQLRMAREKAVQRALLGRNIEDTLGVARVNQAGDSAYYDLLVKDHGYIPVKGFREGVVFEPSVARDLERLIDLVDDQAKHADIMRGFDKTLNLWKAAVTVYNPAFHIRNTAGDMFVSFLNGMYLNPERARRSHKAAIKTMQAIHWQNMDPAARVAMIEGAQMEGKNLGKVVLRLKPKVGKPVDITAEQLWGLYLKYGLKSSFTSSDFGQIVNSTRGLRAGPAAVNQSVRGMSETREDWFRLAHFADVLQREARKTTNIEEMAAKAASDVRKFHFDYTDFTPFERSVLVRAIPFYKWTRKSLPLMVEMLFAKPGAVGVYPKSQSALSQVMGYDPGGDPLVPDADEIVPAWIQNRGAVPLYTSSKGNTVYFDPSNPFNDTVRTWQGENPQQFLTGQAQVNALASMSNPLLRVPVELATGNTFFGNQNIEGRRKQYLVGQTPQTNFLKKFVGGPNSDLPMSDRITAPESLNKLIAAGTVENTDQAQKGELMRLIDILDQQRKGTRKKKGWPEPR